MIATRAPQGIDRQPGTDWHQEVDAFVRAHRPVLVRRAMTLTRDRHEAEDVVQAVLARTLPHWSRIESSARVAYVLRGVHNDVVSRARRTRREVPLDEGHDVADSAGVFDTALSDPVRAAVLALPARQRAVVTLRFLADCSVADTAELLGCSEGTVKSQAFRALATLRPTLTSLDGAA